MNFPLCLDNPQLPVIVIKLNTAQPCGFQPITGITTREFSSFRV